MEYTEKITKALEAHPRYPELLTERMDTPYKLYRWYLCWCEADNIFDLSMKDLTFSIYDGEALAQDFNFMEIEAIAKEQCLDPEIGVDWIVEAIINTIIG